MRIVTEADESVGPGAKVWLRMPPERCGRWPDKPNTASGISRGNDDGADILPTRCAQGFERAGAGASGGVRAGGRAAADFDHARADRGAQKEGKVVYYTSIDLPLAEKIAKAFEAKYPGIAVRVERTGAERVFQRIGQEYGSRIYAWMW